MSRVGPDATLPTPHLSHPPLTYRLCFQQRQTRGPQQRPVHGPAAHVAPGRSDQDPDEEWWVDTPFPQADPSPITSWGKWSVGQTKD